MQANHEFRAGAAIRTVALASTLLFGFAVATSLASPPVAGDHAVGTLVRVDVPSKRMALATDAQTGSELGQGGEINIYVDTTTTATRGGKPIKLIELKPGERLLVRTQTSRNRTQASKVLVLPDTDMDQGPGRYLHGTVGEVRTGTRMLHVSQSESRILNKIGYDEQTTVVTLDGKTVPLSTIKPGDEVDMSLRLRSRITTAKEIVLLRPGKGP
jgi:3-dehydroquinate synthase class II